MDSATKMEYGACACSPLGKVKKVSRPYRGTATPVWTEYEYDASGRVKKVIQPPNTGTAGSSGNTQHSWMGSMLTVTDPKGNYKKYTYDAFGNLVFVVEQRPGGEWGTAYTYDLLNHLTDVNSTRGSYAQARAFRYNSKQQLQTVTTPESGTTTYAYYPSGLLQSKTFQNGNKVEYGYDTLKRLTTVNRFMNGVAIPDVCQSLTLSYDVAWAIAPGAASSPLNRMVTRSWGSPNTTVCRAGQITERLSHNAAGQITGKQMSVNRDGTVRDLNAWWVYDAQGRLTDETYPNSWITSNPFQISFNFGYHYDAMYRLEYMMWYSAVQPSGMVQQLMANTALYNPDQQMNHLTILGKNEWRGYNNLGQLTSIVTDAIGQNSVNLSYDYSPTANDGRAVNMTDASLVNNVPVNETVIYGYDEMKRLTSAITSGPQWGLTFGYDEFGNLRSQTVAKGSGPTQFSLSINTNTNRVNGYTYDANGNVTNDAVRSYGWDAENRLQSVNSAQKYSYDPENLRVYDEDGKFYYFYAPDGRRLGKYKFPTSSPGPWTTEEVYVYVNGRMVVTGNPVSNATTAWFFAVLTDRVGSVRVAKSGALNYYPYGQERVVTGNDQNKFGTYWRDSLTGLDYAQQRYYQSGIGRFLSADPSMLSIVANPASWNRYTYVEGDPINTYDPSGLSPLCVYRERPGREPEYGPCPYALPLPSVPQTIIRENCGNSGLLGSLTADATAAVAVVLGENSYFKFREHARLYNPEDIYGNPTGEVITRDMIVAESQAMVSVLINRLLSPDAQYGSTIAEVAAQPKQFLGYKPGQGRLRALAQSSEGSRDCDELNLAINAVIHVLTVGTTLPSDYLFWKGIIQPGDDGTAVLRHFAPGDIRIGRTDFRTVP